MQTNKRAAKIAKLTPKILQKRVLTWFDKFGRKTLPWQQKKTPYRVWLSEIMLQQTQVSTVIPYFINFTDKFPDVAALSLANVDEVMHLWTGLGYYSRARNLYRAANIIMELGGFPDDLDQLQQLPGIGRSTAGAIMALAFEKRATILDGNVKRVLTRLHGITEWPGERKITEKLWSLAENYTPTKRVADYTQAMMDLGATVCIRGTPHCDTCPLQSVCVAHQKGIAKSLPKPKPRATLPTRQTTLLVLQKNPYTVLLEKRPNSGIWGGLWSLPQAEGILSKKDIQNTCLERFQYAVKQIQMGECFRHTFTHFHLDIAPAFIALKGTHSKAMESTQYLWYNVKQPEAIGLPAPIKKILGGLI